MAKLSVKKGDRVEVIAGKDKGKRGKVLRVIPAEERVVVEKVHMIKRHTKPTQKNPQGGIIEREAPIHVSNVMVVCPSCNQPTRVGRRVTEEGAKVRVCRRCGGEIEKA